MSIKLKFRASTDANKEGSLFFQVIHERVVRQIMTGYYIHAIEWDDRREKIIISPVDGNRSEQLKLIRDRVQWQYRKLCGVVSSLQNAGVIYTADDIVLTYHESNSSCDTVFEYIHKQVERLRKLNKIRTSETYQSTLNSFMKFRDNIDLTFDRMDSDLMELYEAYLKERNVKRNSSLFYMRILRTIYNKAVDEGLVVQKMPFKKVYTSVDKTVKRAITFKEIKAIKNLDLTGKPKLEYARDMFLMSFYLRGMPFVDMAYLKKSDLQNGFLSYYRQKTEQRLTIQWEKHMQTTLNAYPENPTQYLLPIIEAEDGNERKQYTRKSLQINRGLKKIGAMVGLGDSLTIYVSRHSWASIARDKNIPLSVISEALGHDSEKTTQIYLSSIKTSVVDQANSKILKDL